MAGAAAAFGEARLLAWVAALARGVVDLLAAFEARRAGEAVRPEEAVRPDVAFAGSVPPVGSSIATIVSGRRGYGKPGPPDTHQGRPPDKPVASPSMSIARVGIIGSGIMGSGITETAAVNGFEVVLRSRSQSAADASIAAMEKSLNRQIEKEKITESDRDKALALVKGTSDLAALKDCDLVIESVVEDLAVKKELFNELDRITGSETILATNTSTLPVIELAMQTGRPEKVCGVHFFNPAPVMALVELVRPLTASDETLSSVRQFAEACGKTPVEVKDQAGFIVNALLFPYLNNAVRLYEQGVATIEDIDTAMKGGCGFPMGPFALLDLVGLDTSLAILDALYDEFRDPNYAAVPLLRRMVSAEQLGRKSGRGFLDYRK